MSQFILPSTLTDGCAHVRLMSGIKIWFEQEDDLILCTYYVGYTQDDECTGTGATIADAFLAMLVSEWWVGFTTLHPPIAAALDELAHQAVRVVCQRLSGGTLDEATFAEPHLLDTQSGPIERTESPLPGSAGGSVIYPQKGAGL